MTDRTFVDTNILVYARDAGETRKQPLAAECLNQLWRTRSGRISMQVLSEYYVTVTHKLKPGMTTDAAWDDIGDLMSWKPRDTDRETLTRAYETVRRYGTTWWDSMIVAAAELQGCSILLSEDFQEGMVFFGQLRVRNPFTPTVEEPSTAYTAQEAPIPRHRARGRPRSHPGAS